MSRAKNRVEYFKEKWGGKFELLSEFESSYDRVDVRCKTCGHEWNTKPYKIKCKTCGHEKVKKALTLSEDVYVKSLPNNIKLLEGYVNAVTKCPHQCLDCGNVWKPKPASIRNGVGCPICARKKQGIQGPRYSHEQYQSLISDRFIATEKYQGVHIRINHKCIQCGHERKVKPTVVLAGFGCPKRCSSTSEYIRQLPTGLKLSGDFYNFSTPVNHICDNGHGWVALPKDVLKTDGCKFCNAAGVSIGEMQLAEWVESLGFPTKVNCRTLIQPKEIDIVVPEKNLAIEYNGFYWHAQKPNNYHLDKTLECEKQGHRLIHVWEHEIDNPVMRSIIKSALGIYDRKVHARKCAVRNITWKETKDFLNDNHIQGAGAATPVNLGLFNGEELLSVMTFSKPRFKKAEEDWELVRYACKCSVRVVGGASKLFSKKPTGTIFTYSDRRLFTGDLYRKLGFEKHSENKPGYFYANISSKTVLLRYATQKKKLYSLLGDKYNPSLSESENMKNAGYHKIYDCGTIRWVFKESPYVPKQR